MVISKEGEKLIEQFEALRTHAYQDTRGIWTIGYGHTGDVYPGMVITPEVADIFLEQDLQTAEQGINDHVTVPLTQNQFDALTSFVFNVGAHAFANSTLLAKLNSADYTGAADQMLRWFHSSPAGEAGLLRRRNLERDRFLLA